MSRRALLSTDDFRRMAKVAAELGVSIDAKIDRLGNRIYRVSPLGAKLGNGDDSDDLDDRLAEFGGK